MPQPPAALGAYSMAGRGGALRKNACVYSRLKSCSPSEVAAMIEHLLRHCADAGTESDDVDTQAPASSGSLPSSCSTSACCRG